ncbi:hypothetical protein PFISCL1PPCAC_16664, partial [Pristionchus fissidentatus]
MGNIQYYKCHVKQYDEEQSFLLLLPDEILAEIFTMLGFRDRSIARVNKRLQGIDRKAREKTALEQWNSLSVVNNVDSIELSYWPKSAQAQRIIYLDVDQYSTMMNRLRKT